MKKNPLLNTSFEALVQALVEAKDVLSFTASTHFLNSSNGSSQVRRYSLRIHAWLNDVTGAKDFTDLNAMLFNAMPQFEWTGKNLFHYDGNGGIRVPHIEIKDEEVGAQETVVTISYTTSDQKILSNAGHALEDHSFPRGDAKTLKIVRSVDVYLYPSAGIARTNETSIPRDVMDQLLSPKKTMQAVA